MPVSQMPFSTGNAPALLCIGFRSYISAIGYQNQNNAEHKALSKACPCQPRKQNWIDGSVRCNQASSKLLRCLSSQEYQLEIWDLGEGLKTKRQNFNKYPCCQKIQTSPTSHFRDIFWKQIHKVESPYNKVWLLRLLRLNLPNKGLLAPTGALIVMMC